MKSLLIFLFIVGWIFPKFRLFGFFIGVQDVAAILLIFYGSIFSRRAFVFLSLDFCYGLFLLVLSLYFFTIGDSEGVLIAVRTLLFIAAGWRVVSLKYESLKFLIRSVVVFNLFFLFYGLWKISSNLFSSSFDVLTFFYGSDSYRVRAPFEPEGSASSQVPIGYMLALLFTQQIVFSSALKRLIVILGILGTTSRAALLSIALVLARRLSLFSFKGFFSALLLLFLVYVSYLKSFTINEGSLDGSASKRLELYMNSFTLLGDDILHFVTGYGISTNFLKAETGEGFYESFFFNSLMQGGFVLILLSLLITVKNIYYDWNYQLNWISITALIGNAVGGSNYFSMYAYPLFLLIYALKIQSVESD